MVSPSSSSSSFLTRFGGLELRAVALCQRIFSHWVFARIALCLRYLVTDEASGLGFPVLAWITGAPRAMFVLTCMTLSEFLNGTIKFIVQRPRPFWVEAEQEAVVVPEPEPLVKPTPPTTSTSSSAATTTKVRMRSPRPPTRELMPVAPPPFSLNPVRSPLVRNVEGGWESDYSFPSSHAQTMAAIVSAVLLQFKLSLTTQIALVVLVFLMGLARVRLGVHFPSDVLSGWFCGIVLPLALHHIDLMFWFSQRGMTQGLLISACFPPLVLTFLAIVRACVPPVAPAVVMEWERTAHDSEIKRSAKRLKLRMLSKYTFPLFSITGGMVASTIAFQIPTLRFPFEHDGSSQWFWQWPAASTHGADLYASHHIASEVASSSGWTIGPGMWRLLLGVAGNIIIVVGALLLPDRFCTKKGAAIAASPAALPTSPTSPLGFNTVVPPVPTLTRVGHVIRAFGAFTCGAWLFLCPLLAEQMGLTMPLFTAPPLSLSESPSSMPLSSFSVSSAGAAAGLLTSLAPAPTPTCVLELDDERIPAAMQARLVTITSFDHLQYVVHQATKAGAHIRVVGSAHSQLLSEDLSFDGPTATGIVNPATQPSTKATWLISLHHASFQQYRVVEDREHGRLVIAGSAMRLGAADSAGSEWDVSLTARLWTDGMSLSNLPGVLFQTIAGWVVSASDGGSTKYRGMDAVFGIRYVNGRGERVELWRNATNALELERFRTFIGGMGLMGIMYEVVLRPEPAYCVRRRLTFDIQRMRRSPVETEAPPELERLLTTQFQRDWSNALLTPDYSRVMLIPLRHSHDATVTRAQYNETVLAHDKFVMQRVPEAAPGCTGHASRSDSLNTSLLYQESVGWFLPRFSGYMLALLVRLLAQPGCWVPHSTVAAEAQFWQQLWSSPLVQKAIKSMEQNRASTNNATHWQHVVLERCWYEIRKHRYEDIERFGPPVQLWTCLGEPAAPPNQLHGTKTQESEFTGAPHVILPLDADNDPVTIQVHLTELHFPLTDATVMPTVLRLLINWLVTPHNGRMWRPGHHWVETYMTTKDGIPKLKVNVFVWQGAHDVYGTIFRPVWELFHSAGLAYTLHLGKHMPTRTEDRHLLCAAMAHETSGISILKKHAMADDPQALFRTPYWHTVLEASDCTATPTNTVHAHATPPTVL